MYVISADTKELQALMLAMKNLTPQKMDKVLVRALNRTMTMSRTQIVRMFKERSMLNKIKIWDGDKVVKRHKPIEERIIPYKATDAANGAGIGIDHKRISIIAFQAKQDKKIGGGVSYEISKTSGRKMIAHAFINRGIGGTEGVFRRRRGLWAKKETVRQSGRGRNKQYLQLTGPAKTKSGLTPRYPIHLLRGPSLWRMFKGAENMADEIIANGRKLLPKHIMDQVQLIVRRRKGAVA